MNPSGIGEKIGNTKSGADWRPDTNSPSFKKKRFFRLTFPIVRKALLGKKIPLLFFLLLSLTMGAIPTVKSSIESGLVNKISELLRPPVYRGLPVEIDKAENGGRPSVKEALTLPLGQSSMPKPDREAGIPERISMFLLERMTLPLAALAYLVIGFAAFLFEFINKRIQADIGKSLFSSLREVGAQRGLLTDPSEIPSLTNAPGQYASAIQQGSMTVGNTYTYLLDAGQYAFAFLTTLWLIMTQSVYFALGCIVLLSVQVGISFLQAKRLDSSRRQLDMKRNELLAKTDDILSKRDILVAFEQQGKYGRKLNDFAVNYAEVDRQVDVTEAKYRGISDLVTDYGRICILIIIVAIAMVAGRSVIGSIGDVYFLISIYVRLFIPATNLLSKYDSIKRSESTANTFLELLAADPLLQTNGQDFQKTTPWQSRKDIKFDGLSFRYDKGATKNVLDECTFTIPAGKTTLLLGPSGCGKTTVSRLLLKFWPPTEGTIHVGGSDISDFSAHEVRAQMSFVSQGDHIVDDTIGENLSWGADPHITPEQLRSVVESVGIRVKGYDDVLQAPARFLSLGQQQRLSIARMLMDESEIVIMDEPLAGVDVFTLSEVLPLVRRILKDRGHTVLVISHRLAFGSMADNIVIMGNDGKIQEEGDPVELLKHGKVFPKLHLASLQELQIGSVVVKV